MSKGEFSGVKQETVGCRSEIWKTWESQEELQIANNNRVAV